MYKKEEIICNKTEIGLSPVMQNGNGQLRFKPTTHQISCLLFKTLCKDYLFGVN